MDLKLAIFDLGQVCVATHLERSWETWESLCGLPKGELKRFSVEVEEHYRYERGEVSCREFAAWFCSEMSVSLSFEDWSKGWNAIFDEVFEDTWEAIRQMKAAGIKIAALSNTNLDHSKHWKRKYADLLTLMDNVFTSNELGVRKPDERTFLHVLEHYGVKPEQAVFFDDRIENVEAAQKLGIVSVHFVRKNDALAWWNANL